MSLSEKESQTLERIKRALSFQREESKGFLSLRTQPSCQVRLGLRASLRAIQNKEAALVVVPSRAPDAVKRMVESVAEVHNCSVWSPLISSHSLGQRLKVNSPCLSLTFSVAGEADALASIRDHIMQTFIEKTSSNEKVKDEVTSSSKRLRSGN